MDKKKCQAWAPAWVGVEINPVKSRSTCKAKNRFSRTRLGTVTAKKNPDSVTSSAREKITRVS